MADYLSEAMASMATEFARKVELSKKFAEQASKLESESGLSLVKDTYSIRGRGPFTVTLSQLAAIRKVVGRLNIDGKHLAGDFDHTNEIIVTVKPRKVEFDQLSFSYRSKYRPGKCVVEATNSTHKYLVCKI